MNKIKGLVKTDKRFKDVSINFLENQRVEIDAILSQVGGERLWQFISEKLIKLYPMRDYNSTLKEIPYVNGTKCFGPKAEPDRL